MRNAKLFSFFAPLGAIAVVLGFASAGGAQTLFYPDDAILDETNLSDGDAVIGYANQADYDNRVNGTSPNILVTFDGGALNDFIVRNGSKVSFDGFAGSDYNAYDDSVNTFTLYGYAGNNLNAFDRSRVTLNGGYVGGGLNAYSNSVVAVNDGYISGDLTAIENSVVSVTAGPNFGGVGGNVTTYDDSVITIANAPVGGLSAYGNSQVAVTRSTGAQTVNTFDDSVLTLTDFGYTNSLFAGGRSHVTFRSGRGGDYFAVTDSVNFIGGGSFTGSLALYDNSVTTVAGATFDFGVTGAINPSLTVLAGRFNDRVNMDSNGHSLIRGGRFLNDVTFGGGRQGTGVLDILGGIVSGDYYAAQGATLNFYGKNLTKTLVDPNAINGFYSKYTLNGILADGTSVDGKTLYIRNRGVTQVNLIGSVAPEPGTLALIGVGCWVLGVGIRRRPRR